VSTSKQKSMKSIRVRYQFILFTTIYNYFLSSDILTHFHGYHIKSN